jgi:ferrous iron transport protein B
VEDADENTASLSARLKSNGGYTPAAALAMMIFVLLYFPCIATIVAISQEVGGWRWALFSVVYNTALAWVIAWVVYRLSMLIGL